MKEIKKPLIVLNFKSYPEANGEKGIILAKIAENIAQELGVSIAVCPPIPYLAIYVERLNIPIFSQKIDVFNDENKTGIVTVEMIKSVGVSGTIVNHNESKMILAELEKVIRQSRTHRLYTIACANNEATSAAVAKFDPHVVAFVPPELENAGISVSSVQPEVLQNNVRRIKLENPKVAPFCGSGIYNAKDVEKALELGVEGFLLSYVFVKAKNPNELLFNIAKSTLQ